MALTTTTLAGNVSNRDLWLPLTSVAGIAVGQQAMIDAEYVGQVLNIVGNSINVRTRGDAGTAASAHANLSLVVVGPAVELPAPPLAPRNALTLDADTTLTVDPLAVNPITYTIMKATAAAIALNAPSKGQNGLRVTFKSGTAAAHVITYTPGFYGDTTGSDTATFAAKVGGSITLEASNGSWGVYALANVTVA